METKNSNALLGTGEITFEELAPELQSQINLSTTKIYTSLDELGLSAANTIVDIVKAMKDNSILLWQGGFADQPVSEVGTLKVVRININRITCEYINKAGTLWRGAYHSTTGFSGWEQVATMKNVIDKLDSIDLSWENITNKYEDIRGQNKVPNDYTSKGITIELTNCREIGINEFDNICAVVSICAWIDYTGGVYQFVSVKGTNKKFFRENIDGETWVAWNEFLTSDGGTISGAGNGIHFHGVSQNNAILATSGDGANIGDGTDQTNLAIKSWHGVGFVNGCSNMDNYNETTVAIDCRSGDIKSKGIFNGRIKAPADKWFISTHNFDYGINMNNSDLIGLNSLVFADPCNAANEGVLFPKTGTQVGIDEVNNTYYDIVKAYDGNFLFNNNKIYHAGERPVLTANGIAVPTAGGQWISGKTAQSVIEFTGNTNGNYHPFIRYNTYDNHVLNMGSIQNKIGFWGFLSTQTTNATNAGAYLDLANNGWYSNGLMSAGNSNGNLKRTTISTASPSGGANGDVWIKV